MAHQQIYEKIDGKLFPTNAYYNDAKNAIMIGFDPPSPNGDFGCETKIRDKEVVSVRFTPARITK